MRTHYKALWAAIQRYADAQQDNSWKGGGDPEAIPEIERELKESADNLDRLLRKRDSKHITTTEQEEAKT